MKSSRIFGVVSAAAVAFAAASVGAYAAETKGSVTMSDSSWWTQSFLINTEEGKTVADFFGDVDYNSDFTITFTGTGDFLVGYNGADGNWSQSKASECGGKIVVKKADFTENVDDWSLLVALSNADGQEYTIKWTITGEDKPAESDSAEETEAPVEDAGEFIPADEDAVEELDEVVFEDEFDYEDVEEDIDDAAPIAADIPAEEDFTSALDADGFVKVSDGGTSSGWGQAVKLPTYANIAEDEVPEADIFYASLLNENTAVVVTYESDQAPELILQSWSGGEGWAKVPVNETYSSDGVAVFTYDYMTAMYGTDDFSTVDCVYIGDTGVDLTVSEVNIVDISTLGGAGEAAEEDASEDTASEDTASEDTAAAEFSAPAETTVKTDVPNTGNMSAAALAGILAVAGSAALALRKRK